MPKLIPTAIVFSLFLLVSLIGWGNQFANVGAHLGLETNKISLGDWGDSFGAFNAFFSGATLIGVVCTVVLQMRLMKEQKDSIGKEEFERIYFQIFGLIQSLKSKLRYTSPANSPSPKAANTKLVSILEGHLKPKIHEGDEAINQAYTNILRALTGTPDCNNQDHNEKVRDAIKQHLGEKYHIEFSPYFRAIYTLLKRTDSSRFLSEEDKDDYGRLLRSQMSGHEAIILGLNGLMPHSKNLNEYIVRYRMLKYCTKGDLRKYLETQYPATAFRGS